jgi:hypothetical protein
MSSILVIVRYMSDYRRGLLWEMDLLNIHRSIYYNSQISITHRLVFSVCYSLR